MEVLFQRKASKDVVGLYGQNGLLSLFLRELMTATFMYTKLKSHFVSQHIAIDCTTVGLQLSCCYTPFRTWMIEGIKLTNSPCALITRCKHQRPDGGDPGDCSDPGLLRRLPGGGRLPHQGRGWHRAGLLHAPHGGCAGGPSGAGQIPSDGRWVQATRTTRTIEELSFCKSEERRIHPVTARMNLTSSVSQGQTFTLPRRRVTRL